MNRDIEIRIDSPQQFYTPWDSTLNRDLGEYLIERVEELPEDEEAQVVFTLPEKIYEQRESIADTTRSFFNRRHEKLHREYKRCTKLAHKKMLFGFLFIAVCVVVFELIISLIGETTLFVIIGSGLSVVGWVILGRPAEFYIFDRKILKRELSASQRIVKMKIGFKQAS